MRKTILIRLLLSTSLLTLAAGHTVVRYRLDRRPKVRLGAATIPIDSVSSTSALQLRANRSALLGKIPEAALVSQTPVTTTTSTSWFERMQNALGTFCVGLVLLTFSIPVLWFNESRNAQMETLLAYGEDQCRTASAKTSDRNNLNALVHIDGGAMKSVGKVVDPQFSKAMLESDCIRLRSSVQLFQWIEHQQKKDEKEKLGGGKETTTEYTYTCEWSSMYHDSSTFKDAKYRGKNTKPHKDLQLGDRTTNCSRVEYGQAYVLTDTLVEQCVDWKDASGRIGREVLLSNLKFNAAGKEYFHSRNNNTSLASPDVGDAKVTFEYVPDGSATVLALQVSKDGDTKDSFLPYRLIDRGWCGITEHEEKQRLYKEGNKSKKQLADEAMCGGCLGCLCCACNLVMSCCAGLLTPEIYHLFHGSKDTYACFKIIKERNQLATWGFRLAGWVMMFIGLYFLFQPFLELIVLLPVIGPYLKTFAGWLIWILCGTSTLTISSVIVIVAYFFYHPKLAFLYLLAFGAVIAGLVAISNVL